MVRRFIISICVLFVCASSAVAQSDGTRLASYDLINNYSFLSLKTNILYDAVLIPNVGAELNLFNNFTLYGDVMYADWNLPARHVYWNLYGAQAGVRKYFGRLASERSFSGHHAGIYCQALVYDLQAGNIGQQTPSFNIGYGLEYGYSFPVSPSINIDLELGLGNLRGKYYEYDIKDGHYSWRGTVNRNWFGPTKASVSLVWLIKSNRYNIKVE